MHTPFRSALRRASLAVFLDAETPLDALRAAFPDWEILGAQADEDDGPDSMFVVAYTPDGYVALALLHGSGHLRDLDWDAQPWGRPVLLAEALHRAHGPQATLVDLLQSLAEEEAGDVDLREAEREIAAHYYLAALGGDHLPPEEETALGTVLALGTPCTWRTYLDLRSRLTRTTTLEEDYAFLTAVAAEHYPSMPRDVLCSAVEQALASEQGAAIPRDRWRSFAHTIIVQGWFTATVTRAAREWAQQARRP